MCSAVSPGLSTSNADSVYIFDLDETILSVNSFRIWTAYMLCGSFPNLNFLQLLKLRIKALLLMAERKILRHSHYSVKRKLQKLWADHADDEALSLLTQKLMSYQRPELRSLLQTIHQHSLPTVLATAAAGEYAHAIGKSLGFTHILATPLHSEPAHENRGDAKRDSTLAFLKQQGWENKERCFFTDHVEDLPLIEKSAQLFWLGKPEEARSLESQVPHVRVVACLGVDGQQVRSTALSPTSL